MVLHVIIFQNRKKRHYYDFFNIFLRQSIIGAFKISWERDTWSREKKLINESNLLKKIWGLCPSIGLTNNKLIMSN